VPGVNEKTQKRQNNPIFPKYRPQVARSGNPRRQEKRRKTDSTRTLFWRNPPKIWISLIF
jgi:hypothetical protein